MYLHLHRLLVVEFDIIWSYSFQRRLSIFWRVLKSGIALLTLMPKLKSFTCFHLVSFQASLVRIRVHHSPLWDSTSDGPEGGIAIRSHPYFAHYTNAFSLVKSGTHFLVWGYVSIWVARLHICYFLIFCLLLYVCMCVCLLSFRYHYFKEVGPLQKHFFPLLKLGSYFFFNWKLRVWWHYRIPTFIEFYWKIKK